MQSVLVYDIGGSHVSAGLCELNCLQLSGVERAILPDDLTADDFCDLLYRLGRNAAGDAVPVLGAALAVPGPFDFAAGISRMQHKLKPLYGIDLRAALADRFGWEPDQVRFLNDAGAFLLGEVRKGAAQDVERAVGIALGTGIGSAFASKGKWITDGENVPAGGEIWNLPYAGGTVEDLLSTRALKHDYAQRTGRVEEVAAIAARAASDVEARQVFETFGLHLGEIMSKILAPFAPDVVVVGGGISRSSALFLPAAQLQLGAVRFRLVTSSLLDHAALIGAAAYWGDFGAKAETAAATGSNPAGF